MVEDSCTCEVPIHPSVQARLTRGARLRMLLDKVSETRQEAYHARWQQVEGIGMPGGVHRDAHMFRFAPARREW